MTQNDSFDERWSLNPSEKRNEKVEKSVEIPIGNGRKPSPRGAARLFQATFSAEINSIKDSLDPVVCKFIHGN